MGFNKGFEKVALAGLLARGAGTVVRGAARIVGGTPWKAPGAMEHIGLGLTGASAVSDYKKNKNLALGAMQRA